MFVVDLTTNITGTLMFAVDSTTNIILVFLFVVDLTTNNILILSMIANLMVIRTCKLGSAATFAPICFVIMGGVGWFKLSDCLFY